MNETKYNSKVLDSIKENDILEFMKEALIIFAVQMKGINSIYVVAVDLFICITINSIMMIDKHGGFILDVES